MTVFFFGLSDPNVCPFHSWIFGSRAASCLGKKRPVRVLQLALCMGVLLHKKLIQLSSTIHLAISFSYFHHLSVCLSLNDLSTVKALVKPTFFSSKKRGLEGPWRGMKLEAAPKNLPMDFSVGASMPRNLCSQSLEKVSDQRSMTSLRGRPGFISLSLYLKMA